MRVIEKNFHFWFHNLLTVLYVQLKKKKVIKPGQEYYILRKEGTDLGKVGADHSRNRKNHFMLLMFKEQY